MYYKLHPDRGFVEQAKSESAVELQQLAGQPSPREMDAVPSVLPYEYPPAVSACMQYRRGFLRCHDLALGPCGTALWVNPRTRPSVGLVVEDARPPSLEDGHSAEEWLCATLLPSRGKQDDGSALYQSTAHRVWTNPSVGGTNAWTSLDYVESLGWIGLGGSDGSVSLLRIIDV